MNLFNIFHKNEPTESAEQEWTPDVTYYSIGMPEEPPVTSRNYCISDTRVIAALEDAGIRVERKIAGYNWYRIWYYRLPNNGTIALVPTRVHLYCHGTAIELEQQ